MCEPPAACVGRKVVSLKAQQDKREAKLYGCGKPYLVTLYYMLCRDRYGRVGGTMNQQGCHCYVDIMRIVIVFAGGRK